uniref:Uncharacterized protein n=1 Tax=Rhizophora mucronata TaxID=61149 RepID=A0A2P2PVR9_RHIMU
MISLELLNGEISFKFQYTSQLTSNVRRI